MPTDVIIVGAGLFGQIAAAAVRRYLPEMSVTVLDNDEEEAGSKCSACLMKPSWMTRLPKEDVAAGLQLLRELYGMSEIDFHIGAPVGRVNKLVKQTVFHVDPQKILDKTQVTKDTVTSVGDGCVATLAGRLYTGKVYVAAGYWTQQLIADDTIPEIKPHKGAVLLSSGHVDPFIIPWAPYKQAVGFNIDPHTVWFGNGTSILEKNWTTSHEERLLKHASKYGVKGPVRILRGIRPAAGGAGGVYCKLRKHTWVATGGAKNGTILAAIFALRFLNDLTGDRND